METVRGDGLQLTWIQILKVILANSVTLGYIPYGGKRGEGKKEDKNRYVSESIKFSE